jgi:hypothetical protein
MKRAVISATFLVGSIAFTGIAVGQTKSLKDRLVGTWTLNSVENTSENGAKATPYSDHPLGTYMFDAAGHFAEIIDNPDSDGSNINYYGTYSVDEGGKGFTLHIVGSSARKFIGADVKRDVVSISDDAMETHNPTPSTGVSAVSSWKRSN